MRQKAPFSSAKENAKKFCGEKRGVIISQFFLFLFLVLFALQSISKFSFPATMLAKKKFFFPVGSEWKALVVFGLQ